MKNKIIYSPQKQNKLFFLQLSNIWNIDKKTAEKYMSNKKIIIKEFSEEHFKILYELVKNKISKMNFEEQIIYLEYRKKHFDVLEDNRGLEFILSFLFGSSFTGIINYFSDDKISNILFVIAFFTLVFIYFKILISQKYTFNKRLISAIEKNISKE